MNADSGDHDVITTDEVTVFYLTGQDIHVENMMPGYEKDAPRHTFSLENNGKSSQNIRYLLQMLNYNKREKTSNLQI